MPALKDFCRSVRNAEHAVLARLPIQHLWGGGQAYEHATASGKQATAQGKAQLVKGSAVQPRTSLLPSTMAYLYVT